MSLGSSLRPLSPALAFLIADTLHGTTTISHRARPCANYYLTPRPTLRQRSQSKLQTSVVSLSPFNSASQRGAGVMLAIAVFNILLMLFRKITYDRRALLKEYEDEAYWRRHTPYVSLFTCD